MNTKLPIYKLTISDDDESQVTAVALVDMPAIQMNWQSFNSKQTFATTDKDKRIISGALMVADLPIYRRDETGEYYVVFDKQSIQKIVTKFFKSGNTSSVNIMHDNAQKPEGVYMFESWIIDKAMNKGVPKGFAELTDGSWFGSFKVDNDTLWNDFIKTGEFKGFSVEGFFEQSQFVDAYQDTIDKIIEYIKSNAKK